MSLWVHDIPKQFGNLSLFELTIDNLIKASALNDPKSFAVAAIDIAKNGWISSANDWIFNLWPPGFILLEASIIKVFGVGAPLVLILQILGSVLFATVLIQLCSLLRENMNFKFSFFLPLLIFSFPVSRVFYFSEQV